MAHILQLIRNQHEARASCCCIRCSSSLQQHQHCYTTSITRAIISDDKHVKINCHDNGFCCHQRPRVALTARPAGGASRCTHGMESGCQKGAQANCAPRNSTAGTFQPPFTPNFCHAYHLCHLLPATQQVALPHSNNAPGSVWHTSADHQHNIHCRSQQH